MATSDTTNTNQHYVPQMLLRGFAVDADLESVFVLDKQSGKVFKTAIRNIAAERGYYDLDDSADIDAAMNEIDDIASPVIKEIRKRRSLSGIGTDARIKLAGFTIMQLLRTRGFQEHMRNTAEATVTALKARFGGVPPGWPEDVDSEQAREEYLAAIPRFGHQFLPHLLDKDLLLYRTDSTHPFCISDHPVAMNNTVNRGDGIRGTLGLAVPGIEVYLPIGSDLTLAFISPTVGEMYEEISLQLKLRGGFVSEDAYYYLQSRDTGNALKLGYENVRFQNSLQVLNAERFVISSLDDFEDAARIIVKHPEAKHVQRLKVM
jgi:hypothetical protein